MTGSQDPKLDAGCHDRRLAGRLQDPEFRGEFERQQAEIAAIDAIVNELDGLRERSGMTKAALARAIDKNPAAVRRLLTASGNPELRTVVAIAQALGAEVRIVPKTRAGDGRRSAAGAGAAACGDRCRIRRAPYARGHGVGSRLLRQADGQIPAEAFLDSCPTKVEATILAVLEAVRAAPPPAFSGGGKWEAMHGAIAGYYEIRVTDEAAGTTASFACSTTEPSGSSPSAGSTGRKSP